MPTKKKREKNNPSINMQEEDKAQEENCSMLQKQVA